MRSRFVIRLLFVLYCIEAGVFLTLVPWTTTWETTLMQVPGVGFRAFGLHPFVRGFLTSFGVLHILWGAHDLELLLSKRRSR